MRELFADARQRTKESHRAQMRALGMEDIVGQDSESDVGDIKIQGDTYVVAPEPKPQPAPSPVANGLKKFVVPALIGAATLGTGAAGMALYNYLTDKPEQTTTIQNPVQDWKLGLEVRDQP